ncbi:MAG: alkaline phosphatase, partial [Lysobacterales bacterium]
MFKPRYLPLLALSCLAACSPAKTVRSTNEPAAAQIVASSPAAAEQARNLIIFIGDGMGLTTATAARILEGQLAGGPGEENLLAFEEFPHIALAKTYNSNQQTPDSAGTATAIMTGVKTRAGVINIGSGNRLGDCAGSHNHRLMSLSELARAAGLATGIVTTTRITHATPATTYARSAHRNWEVDSAMPAQALADGCVDIARQLLEPADGRGHDVVLGGGRAVFMPADQSDPEYPDRRGSRADGRDLIGEWQARGDRFVWNAGQLADIGADSYERVLGLFEPSHMRYELERGDDPGGEPSLAQMTIKAMELLASRGSGYVLMVEAGRIDHGHHAGNAARALHDTVALSAAVRAAVARADSETLILVTSDHSHVFTMAGYPTRGNPILGLVHGNDQHGEPAREPTLDGLGQPYTTLGYANGPGYL